MNELSRIKLTFAPAPRRSLFHRMWDALWNKRVWFYMTLEITRIDGATTIARLCPALLTDTDEFRMGLRERVADDVA